MLFDWFQYISKLFLIQYHMLSETKSSTDNQNQKKSPKLETMMVFLEALPGDIEKHIASNRSYLSLDSLFIKDSQKHLFKTLEYATDAHLNSLSVSMYESPESILKIAHINFPKLVKLNLYQSCIKNIEALAWLRMPSIEHLDLSQNLIVSLQSLNKLKVPNLKSLQIKNNPSSPPSKVSRCKLNSKNSAFCLNLEDYGHKGIIVNDISFISKVEIKSLISLVIHSEKRIRQHSVEALVRNKYAKKNNQNSNRINSLPLRRRLPDLKIDLDI